MNVRKQKKRSKKTVRVKSEEGEVQSAESRDELNFEEISKSRAKRAGLSALPSCPDARQSGIPVGWVRSFLQMPRIRYGPQRPSGFPWSFFVFFGLTGDFISY